MSTTNTLIPNSFQHPNLYVDHLSFFLTPEEEKVLSKAIREILGWHNKIENRKARIALSVFVDGKHNRDGTRLCFGCGLGTSAVRKALNKLDEYHILCKVGKLTTDGQEFYLQADPDKMDWKALRERRDGWDKQNQAKTERGRQVAEHKRKEKALLSDSTPSVPQHPSPTVTQQGTPSVPQQQRNPVLETQEEPPLADSPPADTFKVVDADGRTTVVVYLDSPVEDSHPDPSELCRPGLPGLLPLIDAPQPTVEDSPPVEDSQDDDTLVTAGGVGRHRGRTTVKATLRVRGDGKPQGAILDDEAESGMVGFDEWNKREMEIMDGLQADCIACAEKAGDPPQDGTDVAFDIAETPETVAFWPEGETPPGPSSREPVEQRVERLRNEYHIEPRENVAVPLEMARKVEKNRAAVAHPDGGDPRHDLRPSCDAPVVAWCRIANKDYGGLSDGARIKLGSIFYEVAVVMESTPSLVAEAIDRFPLEHEWWAEKVGFEWPSDNFCNKLGMMLVPDVEPESSQPTTITFIEPDFARAGA